MNKLILMVVFSSLIGVAYAGDGRPLNKMERQAVIKSVKEQLKDPGSAQFKLGKFVTPESGYYCGMVNSKNSYGGYVGFSPFQGFIFKNKKGGYSAYMMGLDSPEVSAQMCAEKGYKLY